MPRARRRAKPRREFTPDQIKQLSEGISLSSPFGRLERGTADLDAMQAAWNELRDDLLPAWAVAHPFSRPVSHWLFDATEPRERVLGEQRLEAIESLAKNRGFRHSFFDSLNARLGLSDTRQSTVIYESEKQYLCRLDLLFDIERALVR